MAKRRPDAVMTASRAVQRRAEDLLFGHGRAIFDKKKGVASIRKRSAIKNLSGAGQKKTEVLVKISNSKKKKPYIKAPIFRRI